MNENLLKVASEFSDVNNRLDAARKLAQLIDAEEVLFNLFGQVNTSLVTVAYSCKYSG